MQLRLIFKGLCKFSHPEFNSGSPIFDHLHGLEIPDQVRNDIITGFAKPLFINKFRQFDEIQQDDYKFLPHRNGAHQRDDPACTGERK